MTCPDRGTWRAWLDGEAPLEDAETHLEACSACSAAVAVLRSDRAFASSAVATLGPVRTAVPAAPAVPRVGVALDPAPLPRRWRVPVSAAAASVTLVAVLVTPVGREAAADFLAAFRSEQLTPLPLETADAEQTIAVLERIGSIEGEPQIAEPERVADVAEAERRVGFAIAEPDPDTLPAGLDETPVAFVSPERQLRFTFDEARTRAYLDEVRATDRAIPEGYHGAALVLTISAGVLLEYGEGLPGGLYVGETSQVTADVEGAIGLHELRAFLLDLPGLPEAVAAPLRGIEDWRETLPIPVPVGLLDVKETTVGGAEGLLVSEPGIGTGLLWQRDGRIRGVAGLADEAAIRAIAEGLGTSG